MEDNIVQHHIDKENKYAKLRDDLNINQWTGQIFGLEVGSRGYEAKSFCFALRKLGLGQEVVQRLTRAVSLMCMRCSYSIYLSRETEMWRPWEHHQLTRARSGDCLKEPFGLQNSWNGGFLWFYEGTDFGSVYEEPGKTLCVIQKHQGFRYIWSLWCYGSKKL